MSRSRPSTKTFPALALLATAALLALPSLALAAKKRKPQPQAPAAPGPVLSPDRYKIQRTVLPNGLVVITHEDHSVPTIAFWQWFKVGSRNERPGITGLSHFFEHMMFNGSKNVPPKVYDKIIESNGGYSNAFTDRDMTGYYEEIVADRLDTLLFVDSDRMAALSLLPEQLKSEIEVVKEERRFRVDNDIPGMLDEQLYTGAFNASNYRWPVIGWMGDLERITRDEMVEYFRTNYAPGNCILVLTGDFDTRSALDRIKKAFGPIPAQPPPVPPVNSEPEQKGERRAQVHYPAQNVSFMIGYKAPAVTSPDLPALDVLSSILSEGESSRLYQSLVYEKQLALAVSATFRTRIDPTLFEVYVEMRPGKTGAEGEAAVYDALGKIAADGPSERELTKAKNLLEANFVRGLKTNNGAGSQIGYYEHVFGDYQAMFKTVDRYRAVTAADCKRAAQACFDARKRTVVTLVPEEEAK